MGRGKLDVRIRCLSLTVSILLILLLGIATNAFAEEKGILRVGVNSWILKKFPVRQAAEKFEIAHPGVKVRVEPTTPWEEVKVFLLAWKRGKTDTDLAVGGQPFRIATLVGADLLLGLDDMLVDNMARDRFVPAFLEGSRFVKPDGTLYLPILPFMGEVMVLNVNKLLYRKVGLLDTYGNPISARDWNEFEQQLKKLVKVSPGPALSVDWGLNFIMYTYAGGLQAMKGDIYATKEHKILDFESEVAKKWLTLNQKWIQQKLAGSGTVTDVNYGRNNYKAGIIPVIYSAHSRFIEAGETLGEENTSMVPIPGAIENGSIVFTHTVFIPKISPNIGLAKRFIREQIFSKWFQQWGYNHYGKLPVIAEYYGKGITWYQEETNKILDIASKSTYLPKYKGRAELQDIMMEEIGPMLLGEKTPIEALKSVRERIDVERVDLTRLGR